MKKNPLVCLLFLWVAGCSMPTITAAPPASPFATSLPTATSTSIPPATSTIARPEAISLENIDRLSLVERWGYGVIVDTSFAPDASFFVVSSNYGAAVYDSHKLDEPPAWIPFPGYIDYEEIDVSLEGKYLLLTNVRMRVGSNHTRENLVLDLTTGDITEHTGEIEWYQPASRISDWNENMVSVSPDGQHQLLTGIRPSPSGNPANIAREMSNPQDGSRYYDLSDTLRIVEYGENAEPYGCDVDFFTPGAVAGESVVPMQVEWSTNSKTFAILYKAPSYSDPVMVGVYNTEDGQLLQTFGGSDLPVVDLAFMPGAETLLLSYADGSLRLWELLGGNWEVRDFSSNISDFRYSSSGKYVLVDTNYGTEVRETVRGGQVRWYEEMPFAVSPVDDVLALGLVSGDIELRDIATNQVVRTLKGHQAKIYALAYSPDGRSLASSSLDCTVRLWDLETGEELRTFDETETSGHFGEMTTRMLFWELKFIPGTTDLIGFGTWETLVKWDVNTGDREYSIITEKAFSADTSLKDQPPSLFVTDVENNIFYLDNHSYDLETGELLGEHPTPAGFSERCSQFGPITPDGSLQFTQGLDNLDWQVCIIRTGDNHLQAVLPDSFGGLSVSYFPRTVRLAPNGSQLAAASYSGVIIVFEISE